MPAPGYELGAGGGTLVWGLGLPDDAASWGSFALQQRRWMPHCAIWPQ